MGRMLVQNWDDFQRNIVWQTEDGNSVNFWLNKCGPDNNSFISVATNSYVDTLFISRMW